MYTNIDTDYTLPIFAEFLNNSPLCEHILVAATLEALYAFIYHGIHKIAILPQFQANIPCCHYIDNFFGLWVNDTNEETNNSQQSRFCSSLPFGKLVWEVTDRRLS